MEEFFEGVISTIKFLGFLSLLPLIIIVCILYIYGKTIIIGLAIIMISVSIIVYIAKLMQLKNEKEINDAAIAKIKAKNNAKLAEVNYGSVVASSSNMKKEDNKKVVSSKKKHKKKNNKILYYILLAIFITIIIAIIAIASIILL